MRYEIGFDGLLPAELRQFLHGLEVRLNLQAGVAGDGVAVGDTGASVPAPGGTGSSCPNGHSGHDPNCPGNGPATAPTVSLPAPGGNGSSCPNGHSGHDPNCAGGGPATATTTAAIGLVVGLAIGYVVGKKTGARSTNTT